MTKEELKNLEMVFAMARKMQINENPDRQALIVILALEEKVLKKLSESLTEDE